MLDCEWARCNTIRTASWWPLGRRLIFGRSGGVSGTARSDHGGENSLLIYPGGVQALLMGRDIRGVVATTARLACGAWAAAYRRIAAFPTLPEAEGESARHCQPGRFGGGTGRLRIVIVVP